MRRLGFIFILCLIGVNFSCRKDPIIQLPPICNDTILQLPQNCLGGDYYQHSYTYDIINRHFTQSTINGFVYIPFEKYQYDMPIFNPNNSYEFVYGRLDTDVLGFNIELWIYSFCTGKSRYLTDGASHNIDWSSKDWISYTGTNGLIYKIKSSGDSLTSLPPLGGINNAGRWNPSGTLIWNDINVTDEQGEIVFIKDQMQPAYLDWLNDSTILGLGLGFKLYSLNINSEEVVLLNNNWTCASCYVIYNPDREVCYLNTGSRIIEYSLDGSNFVDTIMGFLPSNSYHVGDYANGKRIHTVSRQHWKDSLNDHLYQRLDLVIMDEDGSDIRMIDIPE